MRPQCQYNSELIELGTHFLSLIQWTVKEESMNTMCSMFALIAKRHMKVDFRLEETKWKSWNGHMQTVWGEPEQNIEGYISDRMYGWCWSKLVYSGIYLHNKERERARERGRSFSDESGRVPHACWCVICECIRKYSYVCVYVCLSIFLLFFTYSNLSLLNGSSCC